MPNAIDNTPHMVRIFEALPIKGYQSAKAWAYAESVVEDDNCFAFIQAMCTNYAGTEIAEFVEKAHEFCVDANTMAGRRHSQQSAIACMAIAYAIANFAYTEVTR